MNELTIFLIEIVVLFLFALLVTYLDLQITEKIHSFFTSKFSIQKLLRFSQAVIAMEALITTAPLIILIAVLIKRESPGPVFYKRVYCGAHGRKFTAYKFRTMVNGADKMIDYFQCLNLVKPPAFYRPDEDNPFVTPIGRILRKTGLDELPLLISVLKHDMNIIGPRLITPEENNVWNLYTEGTSPKPGIIDIGYMRRYVLRPGTLPYTYSLQQRIYVNDKKRLAKDRLYIKNPSHKIKIKVFFDFLRKQPRRIVWKVEPVLVT